MQAAAWAVILDPSAKLCTIIAQHRELIEMRKTAGPAYFQLYATINKNLVFYIQNAKLKDLSGHELASLIQLCHIYQAAKGIDIVNLLKKNFPL